MSPRLSHIVRSDLASAELVRAALTHGSRHATTRAALQQLHQAAEQEQQQRQHLSRQQWGLTVQEAVRRKDMRWLYRITKEEAAPPISQLEHAGRTLTDPAAMATAATISWGSIWTKQPAAAAAADIANHMPQLPPAELPPLDPILFYQMIHKLDVHKAAGLDGWRVNELHALSYQAIAAFVGLLRACEHRQSWPHHWTDTLVVLLKKPKPSHKALDQRPISLTSVLYRCWARYRAKQLLAHIDAYLPEAIWGGRPHRCPQDAVWLLRLGMCHSPETSGLHADFSKAYDQIGFPLLERVLRQGGFPNNIATLMLQQCAGKRFIKIQGILGPPQVPLRGLLQGCPLAPLAMGLFAWPLVNHLSAAPIPPLLRTWFDDVVIWVHGRRDTPLQLLPAVRGFREWATLAELPLQEQRTHIWATTPRARQQLRQQQQQQPFTLTDHLRDLGVDLNVSNGGSIAVDTHLARLKRDIAHLRRAGACKLPTEVLAVIAKTLVFSSSLWGAGAQLLSPTWLSNLERTLKATLLSRNSFAPLGLCLFKGGVFCPSLHQFEATIRQYSGVLRRSHKFDH